LTEGTMRLIFTSAALLAPYMGVGPMMFGTIDSTPRCAATSSSHRLCDGYRRSTFPETNHRAGSLRTNRIEIGEEAVESTTPCPGGSAVAEADAGVWFDQLAQSSRVGGRCLEQ